MIMITDLHNGWDSRETKMVRNVAEVKILVYLDAGVIEWRDSIDVE